MASRLTKPGTGLAVARLHAVAVAIAEASVELRSDHPFLCSSEVPGKRPAYILAYAEAFVEAVSKLVHRFCITTRRRESKPLDSHASRARRSQAISVS
jgi:hypothetical protein